MTQSPLDQQTGRAWWHWPTSARSQSSVKGNGPPPHGTATPASAGLGLIARLHQERAAWFGWLPVVIGLGAATYFQLMIEPSLWLAGLVVLAAVVIHRLSRHAVSFGVAATILLFVAIGFAAAKVRTEWVRGPVLERPLGLVSIEAFVERIEPKPKRGARLTLRPIAIEKLTSDQLPIRIRVRVLNAVQGLHPGSVIRLKARLAPPPPPSHPGSFDFARHAWFQSIGAVGYALARPTIEPFTGVVPWTLQARAGVERVRQSIASRMRAILPNQTGAIAIALVTGERGGISETTNQIYRDAGLFHILSISGMHMAVMAGAVFFVVRFGFAAVPTLALQYPTKKWSAMIAAMAALGYLALSGGAFATVRSYIMISVMFFAILIDRPALALRNVALAAVLILLLFPESILDPGFQMSFAAVAALVSVYEALRASKLGQRMADYGFVRKGVVFFLGIVLSTLVAGLAVAPFAAFHFHNTQHLAVLANLIAMPLSNLIVMPAALGVLTLMPLHLEWPAVVAMGFGIDLMTETARWVAGLPGAVGRVAMLPQAAFGLIVMGGLWLVLWHTRWRLFGVALAALGLAIAPYGPRPDILIGNKGNDVAVRGTNGKLVSIKSKRRASFEFKRWLEADGQVVQPVRKRNKKAAKAKTAQPAAPFSTCDAVGCIAKVRGLTVAVAHHAGALRDDCRHADIVVFNAPRPKGCDRPKAVIDFFDVYYGGTHALYLDNPNVPRIESVAATRGKRPWTQALPGNDPDDVAARRAAARAARAARDKAGLSSGE